ncbi:MAG: glucose-6-phosphate dehydrogenase [Actinomycetota bacterium]
MTLRPPDPQTVVIFGATGDLTARKLMPALYNLFVEGLLPEKWEVVGCSRTEMSDDEFREMSWTHVEKHSRTGLDLDQWNEFARHLSYLQASFSPKGAMHGLVGRLKEIDRRLQSEGRRLFYCATPPSALPEIVARIGEEGLQKNARIVAEKPFGHDPSTARELNRRLHEVFEEDQIFRIDHYLGKETVQNILVFRFANGMFEPIWNRRYVAWVEIDVAEMLGIENRGKFYEEAGAMRDIVQNHMLQLLALVAMEPPARFEAESLRDEKVKLLRAIHPIRRRERDMVRGQYVAGEVEGVLVPGYREEADVSPNSMTETFVAMRLRVENWRWAGVPFLLRTGKRLARSVTQVTIYFHDAPQLLFEESGLDRPKQNHLAIRIQPNEGITLTFDAKVPGPEMRVQPVNMNFHYKESFMTKPAEAYERLLHDVMVGDRTLFMRADEIERAWEVVEPVLDPMPAIPYFAGTWGPEQAHSLIPSGRWHLG